MKKLARLTALTMTAGMLLAACGDADDTDSELPATEEPADDDMNGDLDDDIDSGLDEEGLDFDEDDPDDELGDDGLESETDDLDEDLDDEDE